MNGVVEERMLSFKNRPDRIALVRGVLLATAFATAVSGGAWAPSRVIPGVAFGAGMVYSLVRRKDRTGQLILYIFLLPSLVAFVGIKLARVEFFDQMGSLLGAILYFALARELVILR